jgi:hypothetical protein
MNEHDAKLRVILEQLGCVDIDPDFRYDQGMDRPDKFVIVGEYAYAFGPDHMLWMADCEGIHFVDWINAGPVYYSLEFHYGELFKLRAQYDSQILAALEQLTMIVKELTVQILAD